MRLRIDTVAQENSISEGHRIFSPRAALRISLGPIRQEIFYSIETVCPPIPRISHRTNNMDRYVSTVGGSRFWAWLKEIDPYPKPLAWCHTTDAFRLRNIVEDRLFVPRPCAVFGEDLLYFFYGRPAYRFSDVASLHITCRAPVVIVLEPDLVRDGKRMFPFDSGAFSAKRYATWMHESMKLADFELGCPSDAAQRHVSSFYGSNTNYLRLKANPLAVGLDGKFEAESIVALLTDKNILSADDRRTALELQSAKPIPFEYPAVRGLIVPDELTKAAFLNVFLARYGSQIDIHTYELSPLKPAREYQALLEEKASELQSGWGLT